MKMFKIPSEKSTKLRVPLLLELPLDSGQTSCELHALKTMDDNAAFFYVIILGSAYVTFAVYNRPYL